MSAGEITYQIGLTLLEGIGDVLAKNLIAYCGSAEQLFRARKSHLERIPGIGPILAEKISSQKDILKRAEEELKFIDNHGIQALFFTNEKYPRRLRQCHDSPVMLYYKGNADLNAEKVVAVVGTRTPTAYGRMQTEKLLAELAGTGILIVSGLAYGIDYTAHKCAYDHGMNTVGVMAHGLDRIYPPMHAHLADCMTRQGGLLTDFMSGTKPDKENFPERNRIVAGMCDALVVVESKRGGGSLITSTIANSYNKDVFAFPGRAGDVTSEGCNGLIKSNKAAMIESAADLLYMMNWNESEKKKPSQQIPLMLDLREDEQMVVDAFRSHEQLHIDELCYVTGYPVSKVSTILLGLEFSNLVKALPGKMFKLVR